MRLSNPQILVGRLAMLLAVSLAACAQNDAASLTIRFAGGTNQFHVGEVIPIELSFTASLPDSYDMDTRNYDRSGRLNMEEFHVTPSGRDPLANYYAEGAFIGGGLGGSRVLTDEPQVMKEDLNEWMALDHPGHYTLYVTTSRVSRRGATKNEPLQLHSSSLEFDVNAADPEWQQQTLATAVSVLNDVGSGEEPKRAAIRALRFLDTPQSIHELVKRFDDFPDSRRFDCIAGLAGSRHRDLVVQELEQQMNAPDTAITGEYLYTLAKLKFQNEHAPMPPYPKSDTELQKLWQGRMQTRQKELGELSDALFQKVAALVSIKQGKARAETVRTLLLRPAGRLEDIRPFTALPDSEVAAAFLALTPDQQWSLLSTFWERLSPYCVAMTERPGIGSGLPVFGAGAFCAIAAIPISANARIARMRVPLSKPDMVQNPANIPHKGGYSREKRCNKTRPEAPLSTSDATDFLIKYKEAWETHNADLAAGLFTRDAEYRQDPFGPAIVGREAIHDYWAGATGRQAEIHFTVGTFIRSGYMLAAEWTCTYQDRSSEVKKELAGMFLADFYGKQVRHFREYWHSRRR